MPPAPATPWPAALEGTPSVAVIEHATRAFALPRLQEGDATTRRALVAAVRQLEQDTALLRLNLNEAAALEGFLLASLRAWSRR